MKPNMIKKRPKLKRTALALEEELIQAVKKGAKMYSKRNSKISANDYKRGSIITQLKADGLLK